MHWIHMITAPITHCVAESKRTMGPLPSPLRSPLHIAALTVPLTIYFADNFFSVHRVKGTSMEPALKDGDLLLVRRSDLLPGRRMAMRQTNISFGPAELDHARALQLEAEGSGKVPSMLKPPVVIGGDVVAFCDPSKAFPKQYVVKRVIGISTQMVG